MAPRPGRRTHSSFRRWGDAVRALTLTAVAIVIGVQAEAGELRGPGRFCGYSPIVDLREGERIVTLAGGIHGGTFRWEGTWGAMTVDGIGWASRPPGRALPSRTRGGTIRFAERSEAGSRVVAIWNERQGSAYFRTQGRFTAAQIAAIDRVRLFQEGEEPEGCKLRTVFSWEVGA